MAARLAFAEIELVAVLGTRRSFVGEVLAMDVGQVLRLDSVPGQPLSLQVEGVTKLRGMPVIHHGNLAVEIHQTL